MLFSVEQFAPNKAPRFIVLEGVNGAGKTTLQRKLIEYFREAHLSAIATREPGGTEAGKKIRSLVLGSAPGEVSELAEVFLFAADRADHVDRIIRPALADNKIVISDRYFYSSLAFQGYGRGFDVDTIWQVNKLAVESVLPDLVILLDLSPDLGIERNRRAAHGCGKESTKDGPDSFEYEELSFHVRIREGFLQLARNRPEPFIVLDAGRPAESLWEEVKSLMDVLYARS